MSAALTAPPPSPCFSCGALPDRGRETAGVRLDPVDELKLERCRQGASAGTPTVSICLERMHCSEQSIGSCGADPLAFEAGISLSASCPAGAGDRAAGAAGPADDAVQRDDDGGRGKAGQGQPAQSGAPGRRRRRSCTRRVVTGDHPAQGARATLISVPPLVSSSPFRRRSACSILVPVPHWCDAAGGL